VPESESVTHYFFAVGRNVAIEDREQTKLMGNMTKAAFEREDESMIRECQRLMGTNDVFSLGPAILKTDVAGVQARRTMAKLIAAEHSARSGTAVARAP
jgi:vanillate O-demethylase monooxygenase subunit